MSLYFKNRNLMKSFVISFPLFKHIFFCIVFCFNFFFYKKFVTPFFFRIFLTLFLSIFQSWFFSHKIHYFSTLERSKKNSIKIIFFYNNYIIYSFIPIKLVYTLFLTFCLAHVSFLT